MKTYTYLNTLESIFDFICNLKKDLITQFHKVFINNHYNNNNVIISKEQTSASNNFLHLI